METRWKKKILIIPEARKCVWGGGLRGSQQTPGCPSTSDTTKESKDAAIILERHSSMKANNE